MNPMLITIFIGVPLYQLAIRYVPNMLKRMGLGLLSCLVKVLAEIAIHATMTNRAACKNFAGNSISYLASWL